MYFRVQTEQEREDWINTIRKSKNTDRIIIVITIIYYLYFFIYIFICLYI